MSIKLVAFDMDGTLLDSNKNLPPDFMDWVVKHPEIKTVIASGRQYYKLVKDFVPIKKQLVFASENGGFVFENDQVLYSNEMKKEDILRCLELIWSIEGLTPVLCGAESAYIERTSESVCGLVGMYYERLLQTDDLRASVLQDTIVKIAVLVDERRAETAIRNFKKIDGHLSAVLSGDSWIDFSNQTANKGAAIIAIQKKYGIKKEECMAFGDYLNDVEMLQCCGESYCMENGHPDLKRIAKYIAASNDNNGVMDVLRQIGETPLPMDNCRVSFSKNGESQI